MRAAFGSGDRHEVGLNRSYRELARYYGFKVDPTPVRAPKKKGKVESGVKYIKGNFVPTCAADLALAEWVSKTAGMRVHGETGRRPLDVFDAEERSALLPLPAERFELVVWKPAKVHVDAHIETGGKLYSVPWRTIGKRVWVRSTSTTVQVYLDETRIATHDRVRKGRASTNDEHLPEGRRDLRHRHESYWLERAGKVHPEVVEYIGEVLASDDALSKLRDVQAIVAHLEKFPLARARAAVKRARFYANYSYAGIRNILRDGLDYQPLPQGRRRRAARRGRASLGNRRSFLGVMKEMSPLDELVPVPKKLRLSGVLQSWDVRHRQAVEGELSHAEFVLRLLTDELSRRDGKQVELRVGRAGFEHHKTLEDFNFQFNPKVPKAKILDLCTVGFITSHTNVLLLGPSGVGKSHLANAIGHRACMAGHATQFISAKRMFATLRAARADGTYDRQLGRLTTPALLIIDDLGLRPLAHDEPMDLYEVIRQRYERASTLITSNRDVPEWHAMFGGQLLASAAMDRLLHHAEVITLDGRSYRTAKRSLSTGPERQDRPADNASPRPEEIAFPLPRLRHVPYTRSLTRWTTPTPR